MTALNDVCNTRRRRGRTPVTSTGVNRRMRENRMSGGVGGVTGAIPSPRPDPPNNSATSPACRGDPRGRPSRIRHGFVSFVRGGVPRPCGVPYRPERGRRETGMGDGEPCGRDSVGDDKRRPYPRTTRRRGPRRGDPRGRPSRDPRGRPSRIQHGFVSFVRGGVPRPCGVPYRPERGHRETGMGDGEPCGAIAWATTSVAPTPEQLGDEARV